jgi:hypothetical protein
MKTWQSLCATGALMVFSSGVALSQTTSLEAQRTAVIKVQAHFAKQRDEIAAGLFVGQDQQNAYFITARHAIVDDTGAHPVPAQSVKLQFYNSPQSVNASVFEKADPILDLGVVYLPLANLPPNLPQIVRSNTVVNTSVRVIGHPAAGDWSVWQGTVLNENAPGGDFHHFITSSNPSLAKGYSGGPEFDPGGNFLGMQIETEASYGIAAKSAEIILQLNAWRVPTNYLVAGAAAKGGEPPTAQQADLDSIKSVLGRYEDAYNLRDAGALWQIWPSAPAKTRQAIEASFRSAASIRMTLQLSTPSIAADHVNATVRGQFSQMFTPRNGSTQPRSGDIAFSLQKNNDMWAIVDIK